jgi:hypothetical protein
MMSQDAQRTGAEPLAPGDADRADLDALVGLDDLPVGDHVARFEAVHDALRVRLAGGSSGGAPADGGGA